MTTTNVQGARRDDPLQARPEDHASTTRVLRPDLEALPPRLRKLPLDARGYPVPWFVAWIDGVPDHRVVNPQRFGEAVKQRRCWVCGEPLGRWLAFPIGSMCAITRTISEPPSHLDCAEWSVKNCPFLSKPEMVRREEDRPADWVAPAGNAIMRNPGVMCLWVTRSYEIVRDAANRPLFQIGAPERVSWWREGRAATREEVDTAVTTGFPLLLAEAKRDGPVAVEMLEKCLRLAEPLFPRKAHATGIVDAGSSRADGVE